MQDPRDVIAAKRDGLSVPPGELEAFIEDYVRGDVPDYLAAAFLMAAYIRGLSEEETLALTRAYVASGRTVALESVSRPTVDKHSTGGVADGVTLAFAPTVAALGLGAAKLSGRGLGHTGGTLDKLESIPGLRTDLSIERFVRQVDEVGCAVAAQTADLVPADGALYALRDATATVASIPLIAASVMSKKLAVETDLILLDVKVGSGAFMKSRGDAEALAGACAALARASGRAARAAVTDMSQPLGEAIGNALDIVEAVEVLSGHHRGRLRDLVMTFAARALVEVEGLAEEEASDRARRVLDDGSALERFARMIEAQGGDPRVTEDPRLLPRAPVVVPITAPADGSLIEVDAESIGRASSALGAGRVKKDDPIDPAVGIVFRPKIGDLLEAGSDLGEVHARTEEAAATAVHRVLAAIRVSADPVDPVPLVRGWFG